MGGYTPVYLVSVQPEGIRNRGDGYCTPGRRRDGGGGLKNLRCH